jgi:hypothetical protein
MIEQQHNPKIIIENIKNIIETTNQHSEIIKNTTDTKTKKNKIDFQSG